MGSQDQVSAAYGGINQISFLVNGDVTVRPLTLPRDRLWELNSQLMLFYTGIKRTASQVASSFVNDLDARARQLEPMKEMVERGCDILNGNQDLTAFGQLLHEGWQMKRSLSQQVSNDQVDELYTAALSAGAVGGKLLGAGGGGFLLLFVPISHQQAVRQSLNRLLHVPFDFEYSGSHIVFFDQEADYSEQEKARANQPISAFRELFPPKG